MRFDFKRYGKVLSHPITTLIIGVVVTVFISWWFTGNSAPSYAVLNPDTIASVTNKSDRLQLVWDGEQLDNAHSTKVLLWNAGKKHLALRDLKKSAPLRIVSSNGLEILDVQLLNSSRDAIGIAAEFDAKSKYWRLNFNDNESLESNEGVELWVLFTSHSESPQSKHVQVLGGVTGHKNGWERKVWPINSKELESTLNPYVVLPILIMMLSLITVITIKNFVDAVKNKSKGDVAFHSFLALMLLLACIVLFPTIISAMYDASTAPDWLR